VRIERKMTWHEKVGVLVIFNDTRRNIPLYYEAFRIFAKADVNDFTSRTDMKASTLHYRPKRQVLQLRLPASIGRQLVSSFKLIHR
jgi:hypothetical protein